jgi:hypothetical protein
VFLLVAATFSTIYLYLGGTAGITASGLAYRRAGWRGVVALVLVLLLIPVAAGILEARSDRPGRKGSEST